MTLITINGASTNSTSTAEDVQAVTDLDSLHDVDIINSLATNDVLNTMPVHYSGKTQPM